MPKSDHFQDSLRTSASEISINIYDEETVRQPPQKIRQNKFTKTYCNLKAIPLPFHIPTLITENIQHLYLSHNNIISLQGIENYPNLISLNVSYNRLTVIEELKMIQNQELLVRIGLKMNDFVYGYQDYAIKLFRNLQRLDDIELKDRKKVKEMWNRGQKVACDFLDFYIRMERILYFMNDLVSKSKLHQQMGLSQARSRYPNSQLKLLFEHMTEQFIAKVSQNFMMPTEEQFLHLSSLEILKKTSNIIQISLEENIDFNCTCRPRLPYDQEVKKAFSQISQRFLSKFNQRYNKNLQNGLKKVQARLTSIYPKRSWDKWELYGMLQNYLELGTGGKRISNIFNQKRQNFQLFTHDQTKNTNNHFLKGKKPYKADLSWRNAIFSDVHTKNQENKQNQSPNITYFLNNNSQYQDHMNKLSSKEYSQTQKQCPEMFFDRIPMVLYEKNYVEILMEITMEKVKQMLQMYDELVKIQKEFIQKNIVRIEAKSKEKILTWDQKLQNFKKNTLLSTKRTQSIMQTERNRSNQRIQRKRNTSQDQRMLKSTVANNSPLYTQRLEEGAATTVRQYLQRKDSQISFGKTSQNEHIQIEIQQKKDEKKSKISKRKHRKQKSDSFDPKNSQYGPESYSFYQISLAYKVFRSLKLQMIKGRKKSKPVKQ